MKMEPSSGGSSCMVKFLLKQLQSFPNKPSIRSHETETQNVCVWLCFLCNLKKSHQQAPTHSQVSLDYRPRRGFYRTKWLGHVGAADCRWARWAQERVILEQTELCVSLPNLVRPEYSRRHRPKNFHVPNLIKNCNTYFILALTCAFQKKKGFIQAKALSN